MLVIASCCFWLSEGKENIVEIIAAYGFIFLIIAVVFGLYMTWGVGANDLANAMGTSVGAGAVTVKQAICIAIVFEFLGAVLAGGHVTTTIRKGIVDPSAIINDPQILVYGMLASLLSAAVWLTVASAKGWPVSTTHSIVGAIVGFAIVGIGIDAVSWDKIIKVIASWIVSPLVGGTISFLLVMSIRKLISNTDTPLANAKKYAPVYVFLVGFVISLVTLFKGLKHLKIDLSIGASLLVAVCIGGIVAFVGWLLIKRIKFDENADRKYHFAGVEKVFTPLMLFTACSMAIGGGGIVLGLVTLGYRVMLTVGKKITELTPSSGFCAELAAATTVVLASRTGIPVSTTHILVGSVFGVGLARGVGALDLKVVLNIIISWLVTLPAGGFMAAFFFFTLKGIFG
jgi:PiT family inorganic phosphate transporter